MHYFEHFLFSLFMLKFLGQVFLIKSLFFANFFRSTFARSIVKSDLIRNCISKALYCFKYCKIICNFVSFLKHFSSANFFSCFQLFYSLFMISGFSIAFVINIFIIGNFLPVDSIGFNASTCFFPSFSIYFVCFFNASSSSK